MDYYQGVVADYLRAEQAVFVSPEYNVSVEAPGKTEKGKSWWIDVLAVDFKTRTVFLCEVSYSKTLAALAKRLSQWTQYWDELKPALLRQAGIPDDWNVEVWAFTPESLRGIFEQQRSANIPETPFIIRWTPLEATPPWAHNRGQEAKNKKLREAVQDLKEFAESAPAHGS